LNPKLKLLAPVLIALIAATPTFAQENPPNIPPNAQRVTVVEESGGLVTSAVALSSTVTLMAENSSLVTLNTAGQTVQVLDRRELGHGIIFDLVQSGDYVIALTEDGVVSLGPDPLGGIPIEADFAPGGGQAVDVRDEWIVVAAREVGIRVLKRDADGSLQSLSTLSLGGEALDVAISPDEDVVYVAVGALGAYSVELETNRIDGPLLDIAPAHAVAFSGRLLSIGSGGRVYIADVDAGRRVGVYAPLSDGRRIVVDGEYAYIADAQDGLKILWLTSVDRPVQTFGEVGRPALDLATLNGFTYVAGMDSLRIYDTRNRFRPLELGQLQLPGQPTDIAVIEDRAFVALGEDGVAVIDIRNISQPRLLKRIPLDGPAQGVAYDDGFLYVTAGDAGLVVINASELGQETIGTSLMLPGPAYDMARRGNGLFIAGGQSGVIAVDITRRAAPVLASVLPAETSSDEGYTSIHITGKRAYLSEGTGFLVADVSYPYNMGRLTRVEGPAHHVAVGSIYLYVLAGERISIYDARATAEPVYLRQYSGIEQINQIDTRGNYLFLSNAGKGPDVVAIGLSTPDTPYETDNFGQLGHTFHATPTSNSLLLARGNEGLRVTELTEAGSLIPRNVYNQSVLPEEITADAGASGDGDFVRVTVREGDSLFVAAGDSGVLLYSSRENGEVLLTSQQKGMGASTDIVLRNNFAYAADGGGLAIYDRSFLIPVARVNTPAAATGIDIYGTYAYLSLSEGSLAVIDTGDPVSGLRSRGSLATGQGAELVQAPDGNIYIVSGDLVGELNDSNPDRIFLVDDDQLAINATKAFIEGGELYAFGDDGTVRSYLLSLIGDDVVERDFFYLGSSEQPGVEIFFEEDIPAISAAVKDGLAYAAYGPGGLGWLDISQPGTGQIFFDEEVNYVVRRGDILFSVGESLTAWNIATVTDPRIIEQFTLTAPGLDMSFPSADNAIISTEAGVMLVNWDGRAFEAVGQYDISDSIDHAVQIGNRAYLAKRSGGVLVLDLRDPKNPVPLFSTVSEYGQFAGDLLAVDDNTLLISWEGGIEAYQTGQAGNVPRLLTVIETGAAQTTGIDVSEDGQTAVVTTGDDGIIALDLTDPEAPVIIDSADTPGAGLSAEITNSALYIADGECGLRVLDRSSLDELGYWKGNYVSNLLFDDSTGAVQVTDADRTVTLAFDPTLSAVAPTVPQVPQPVSGADNASLDITLTWSSGDTECDTLVYDVYFGTDPNPPFFGQVTGAPVLEVGRLRPGLTYYWHVSVTDRQGDRVDGPIWQFTTQATRLPSPLPDSPPPFLQRLIENPAVPIILGIVFFGAVIGTFIYLRRQNKNAT